MILRPQRTIATVCFWCSQVWESHPALLPPVYDSTIQKYPSNHIKTEAMGRRKIDGHKQDVRGKKGLGIIRILVGYALPHAVQNRHAGPHLVPFTKQELLCSHSLN